MLASPSTVGGKTNVLSTQEFLTCRHIAMGFKGLPAPVGSEGSEGSTAVLLDTPVSVPISSGQRVLSDVDLICALR